MARALAGLAKSLEADGHDAQVTAGFLQRCLFTMFAEDIGLLPENAFVGMMERVKDKPAGLATMLGALWKDMAEGSQFSLAIQHDSPLCQPNQNPNPPGSGKLVAAQARRRRRSRPTPARPAKAAAEGSGIHP